LRSRLVVKKFNLVKKSKCPLTLILSHQGRGKQSKKVKMRVKAWIEIQDLVF